MIAGQKAQITRAKKSISTFRLREGQEIGCRVTLRGKRMYEFLDRLINARACPESATSVAVNPRSFDGNGNYNMGLSEQLVFPEIDPDKVNFTQGMDINICTSGRSDDEGSRTAQSVRHAVSGVMPRRSRPRVDTLGLGAVALATLPTAEYVECVDSRNG